MSIFLKMIDFHLTRMEPRSRPANNKLSAPLSPMILQTKTSHINLGGVSEDGKRQIEWQIKYLDIIYCVELRFAASLKTV